MDYEKKYKEALEKAIIAYKDEDKHIKATLERIFSELRESEDERMIKAIKHLLINKDPNNEILIKEVGISCYDMVAWLEKQGEQKSMKTCAEYYNQDNELKMPELSEFQDKLADILMYREYDGPDETEDDIAKGRLEYELAAIRLSEELLPLAQKEQKPAWNEEDENRMNNLCHFLEEYGNQYYGYLTLQDTISWLKSLIRPQDRWKPTKEQVDALLRAVNRGIDFDDLKETSDLLPPLTSLYKDLKKLL